MLGHKIIAAAANDKPFDIKELVNEALHLKANELLSEGFKIVADKQYGGIFENRYRGKSSKAYGSRKVRKAEKAAKDPSRGTAAFAYNHDLAMDRFYKNRALKNPKRLPESELEEGRARLGKAASARVKMKDKIYGNRKLRNAMKSAEKPGMTRSDKTRAQKKAGRVAINNAERFNKRNGIPESELEEGRARLGKAASARVKMKDKIYGNRKLRNAMKSAEKPGMTRSDKTRAQKKAGRVAINNAERFNKRNGI